MYDWDPPLPNNSETDELISVKKRVNAICPGIALDSPIQGFAFLEEFDEGIKLYEGLANPSMHDDRWAGVCYFQLFQDSEAQKAFKRAIQRGNTAARINLAHLLAFEDMSAALYQLKGVNGRELQGYELVLFNRIRSLLEEANGNLRQALTYAEQSWRQAQGLPEFRVVAPSILSQLGVLYGRIGHAKRALFFLDRALQITKPNESPKAILKRSIVLNSLGLTTEAVRGLDGLECSLSATLRAELYWLLGEVSWTENSLSRATKYFTECIELAEGGVNNYAEFLSRLGLVALAKPNDSQGQAEEHLEIAQKLITDQSDQLYFRFRELQYKSSAWRPEGSSTNLNDVVAELRDLQHAFERMGLLQEGGWVKLHCAETLWRLNSDEFLVELDSLKALAVTLQNPAFLGREWLLIPDFEEIAWKTHPDITNKLNNMK